MDEIQALLSYYGEPLPGTTTEAFGELFDRYGDAKVVLIGEASHGSTPRSSAAPKSNATAYQPYRLLQLIVLTLGAPTVYLRT